MTGHPGILAFPLMGALATALMLLFGAEWFIASAPVMAGFAVAIVLAAKFKREEGKG